MLLMVAGAIYVVVGVRWWKFALILALGMGAAYYAWHAPNILHDYQKARIMTFTNPESDLQGAGYHITQSRSRSARAASGARASCRGRKAISTSCRSGRPTSFFTMFAEEFGMVGSLVLLGLYVLLVIYGMAIGIRCKNQFRAALGVRVELQPVLLLLHQHRDGDGPDPGGGRAACRSFHTAGRC